MESDKVGSWTSLPKLRNGLRLFYFRGRPATARARPPGTTTGARPEGNRHVLSGYSAGLWQGPLDGQCRAPALRDPGAGAVATVRVTVTRAPGRHCQWRARPATQAAIGQALPARWARGQARPRPRDGGTPTISAPDPGPGPLAGQAPPRAAAEPEPEVDSLMLRPGSGFIPGRSLGP